MKTFDDDVNGIVIGDVKAVYCQVYYDGRPQHGGFWADSYDHACLVAKEIKASIRADMGMAFADIFPNDALWEVRIHGAK